MICSTSVLVRVWRLKEGLAVFPYWEGHECAMRNVIYVIMLICYYDTPARAIVIAWARVSFHDDAVLITLQHDLILSEDRALLCSVCWSSYSETNTTAHCVKQQRQPQCIYQTSKEFVSTQCSIADLLHCGICNSYTIPTRFLSSIIHEVISIRPAGVPWRSNSYYWVCNLHATNCSACVSLIHFSRVDPEFLSRG